MTSELATITAQFNEPRPRLRGWLHMAAAPIAVTVTVLLARSAPSGASRASVIIFGIGLIGLFTVSGTYHVPPWPARVRLWLSKADVAMIQLFIAATFTPIAVHTLKGEWRTWSLIGAWVIAIGGAIIAASPLKGPRWLGVAGYVTFGGLALAAISRAMPSLPLPANVLLIIGTLGYLVGGIVYARRRPNPWPEWFAFHEVFHAVVVISAGLHVAVIWRWVVPLAGQVT